MRWLANSTIRMAFLAVRLTSISRPIWPYTSSGRPRSMRPPTAPNMARGTVTRMMKGSAKFS